MENIEDALNHFRNELRAALSAFYVWEAINNIAAEDQNVLEAINNNPLFWNIILNSLHTSIFIGLGRIFDIDDKVFSVHSLLRICARQIDQFSEHSLRKRKISLSGGAEPEWLPEYMNHVYIPVKDDFKNLKKEISNRQKLYESVYRPIRNKVIAHKELSSITNVGELFEKTKISEIHDFFWVLYQIENIVFDLLHNGILNPIGYYSFNENNRIKNDIKLLMNKISNPQVMP